MFHLQDVPAMQLLLRPITTGHLETHQPMPIVTATLDSHQQPHTGLKLFALGVLSWIVSTSCAGTVWASLHHPAEAGAQGTDAEYCSGVCFLLRDKLPLFLTQRPHVYVSVYTHTHTHHICVVITVEPHS